MPVGTQKDYYKALGVERSSKREQIRKAYRRLARKYHPDLNPGMEGKRFRQIMEAYDVLSDRLKRKQYDRLLREAQEKPQEDLLTEEGL